MAHLKISKQEARHLIDFLDGPPLHDDLETVLANLIYALDNAQGAEYEEDRVITITVGGLTRA